MKYVQYVVTGGQYELSFASEREASEVAIALFEEGYDNIRIMRQTNEIKERCIRRLKP